MSPKAGKLRPWLATGLTLTLALASVSPAWAQMGGMGPGMGPGMGRPGGAGAPREDKDEGPAEVAPDAEEKAPPAKESDAGYLEQARRRTKVVEFDGYLRLRTDFLHKMNLDQGYNAAGPGPVALPPSPTPSECLTAPGQGTFVGCSDKSLGSGNMRLRIEPTTVSISPHARLARMLLA